MIVAEIRVYAIGEGTSQREPVQEVVSILENLNLDPKVGPLGTVIETDTLDEILNGVHACHARLKSHGGRIVTQLTLEERVDKEETAESLANVRPEPDRVVEGARREPQRERYPEGNPQPGRVG